MNRSEVIKFITSQKIQKNGDKPWNWGTLSENPNITWDMVLQNPDETLNWCGLSYNSNITWDIVRQNLDKPWNWSGLSLNSNITRDIVQQNPDKPWDWFELSRNPNFLCADEDILEYYIRQKAASCIQKWFREANMNPRYLLCQKRIYGEFEELIVET